MILVLKVPKPKSQRQWFNFLSKQAIKSTRTIVNAGKTVKSY